MSLFKAREWWSTVVGEDEEFDHGCLCVASIDSSSSAGAMVDPNSDKIIVGSFHGFLRIYNPRPTKSENGWSGFQAEDVLCESHLSQPILQVEAGKFISGSESIHVAVLHPRKVSVYSVVGSQGQVQHGTQYALKLAYEHNLKRTAFNFCYGPFGGVRDKDFLCVQSMDGTVSVFEQESFAFCRFLPGALIPGPIQYVQRTDSFVTVSSARQVESYKYQVLAVATDAKTKQESQNIKSGKKVVFDWTLNIGEQALDLSVINIGSVPPSVLVLGERNLYILTDTGKLRFMKKFDYNPSCFLPYKSTSEGSVSCIIGTHTKTLLIYNDITMKWAAQMTRVPVQVKVGNFHDLKGVLVTLGEEGHLQCSYLGTDPSMFMPPTVEVREIDYAEQDNEMRELQKVIKEQQHKQALPLPTTQGEDDIQLEVYVPPDLDDRSQAIDVDVQDEDPIPSITITVQLKAKVMVNDVRVMIHAPPPLAATESLISFPCLDPGRPAEIQVTFFLRNNFIPADLKANVTATFQASSGAPRVVETHGRLPLKLVVKPCLAVKNATYKLTIDTNKAPVNLNDIFPDLLGENAGGAGNALGFQIYGGPVITVLASKTSQRYRLQCDTFEAIWLLLSEITKRLNSYHKQRHQKDFRVTYEGALPLQDYFDVIDRHFDCRQNDDQYKKLLAERANQFRAIQRRLLTRFKDKTPAPLANLDTLLDGTYRQLLALADASEENRRIRQQTASSLSAATRMLNLLIKMWADMSDKEFNVLEATLSPNVTENGDQEEEEQIQGWEEIVDAAITHLLRTCLAKNSKDTTVNPAPLTILKETAKLKKHIALMCDRLSKGAKLVLDGQADTGQGQFKQDLPKKVKRPPIKVAPGLDEDSEHDTAPSPGELGEAEVPLGSKFGEKKSPRRSADLPPLNGPPVSEGGIKSGALPPLGSESKDLGKVKGRVAPEGRQKQKGGRTPSEGNIPRTETILTSEDEESSGGAGRNYMKKKPEAEEVVQNAVPDLDDLGMDGDAPLLNGGAELVYGL